MAAELTPAVPLYGGDAHRVIVALSNVDTGAPVDHAAFVGTWTAQARRKPEAASEALDLAVTVEGGALVVAFTSEQVRTITDSRSSWGFDVVLTDAQGNPATLYRGELDGTAGYTR